MKILTWTAGALFFLGVALTTYLLIDGEGAARVIDAVIPLGASGAEATGFAKTVRLIKTNFLFYGALTLVSGIFWASLAERGRRRFQRAPRVPSHDGARFGRPAAHAPQPTQDFLNQLETNWKTFASYTQDILHRKIKELEEAPQKALKEMTGQAAALWKALEEVKRSVALARSEIKETSQGIQERIGAALGDPSKRKEAAPAAAASVEPLLKRVEKGLGETGERFSRIEERIARLADAVDAVARRPAVAPAPAAAAAPDGGWRKIQEDLSASAARTSRLEERVGALLEHLEEGRSQAVERRVEKFKQETLARIASLTAEIEEVKKERDRLRGAEARSREVESSLRAALQSAEAKEKEHLKQIAEAAAREDAGSRKVNELASEGERLRKDLERAKADAAARASMLGTELEQAKTEREKLRGELGRAREAEAGVRADLERTSGREKELEKRLAEAASREEHGSRRIKDLSGEVDRLRKDLDRRGKAFEEERAKLSAEVAELSAQGSQLESDMEEALSTSDRLQGLLQSREAELAGLRASMEALRVDKERLDQDARRLGEEVKSLRSGKVDAEKKRLKDLMEENAVLKREIAAARESLENGKAAAGAGSKADGPSQEEFEALRRELEAERSRKAANAGDLEAEAKQLRSELGEVEGRWMARVAELEAKLSEAEEARLKLASQAEKTERIDARLPAAGESAGASTGEDAAERLRELEREKGELVASLGKVGEELERLRADVEGFRRFHGALIQGSIPAAIVAADVSLKIFAWNPAAEALWGVDANSVLGSHLPDVALKGLDGKVIEQAKLAMRERKSLTLPQSSFADANGASRHVRWTCDPVLGPDGDALGVVIIAEDLTAEVERQIESRLQALFSQSLLRSIPAGVVVLDSQRRVISWNRKAEAVLGIPESEAIGQEFFSLPIPLAKSAFERRFAESLKDGAVHRLRVRFEVNGAPGNHVITQAPFYGDDDSVRGAMLLLEAIQEPELAGGRAG
jgi:PAS domain S-box-containing protein